MQRAVLLTGIGGQGVQLAAEMLARAAVSEGRDVQLFGGYGGMMRGGNTDATVVIADGRVEAPPTVQSAWAAVIMHPQYAAPTIGKIADGGVALVNSTVWHGRIEGDHLEVVTVAAGDLAVDLGNVLAASMVMIGALSTVTRLVRLPSLVEAAQVSVPQYRRQHIELNERALRLGARRVSPLVDAWSTQSATTTAPSG